MFYLLYYITIDVMQCVCYKHNIIILLFRQHFYKRVIYTFTEGNLLLCTNVEEKNVKKLACCILVTAV